MSNIPEKRNKESKNEKPNAGGQLRNEPYQQREQQPPMRKQDPREPVEVGSQRTGKPSGKSSANEGSAATK